MVVESILMNLDYESDFVKYGGDILLEKDGGVWKIIKVVGGGGDKLLIGSKVRVYYFGRFLIGEEFDLNIGKKDLFEFEYGKGMISF